MTTPIQHPQETASNAEDRGKVAAYLQSFAGNLRREIAGPAQGDLDSLKNLQFRCAADLLPFLPLPWTIDAPAEIHRVTFSQ